MCAVVSLRCPCGQIVRVTPDGRASCSKCGAAMVVHVDVLPPVAKAVRAGV